MKEDLIDIYGFNVTSKQEKEFHEFIYKIFKLSEWEKLDVSKKKSLIKAFLDLHNKPSEKDSKISEIQKQIEDLEQQLISASNSTNNTISTDKSISTSNSTDAIEPSSVNSSSSSSTSSENVSKFTEDSFEKTDKSSELNSEIKNVDLEKSSSSIPNSNLNDSDLKQVSLQIESLKKEIGKMFIGQREIVHMVILALLCEAHILLEGVPGLAKSVLIETLSRTIKDMSYKRIQFIPDMLPSDLIGGQIYNPKTNEFVTIKGPIFANLVLTDEINRAPPKVHAALMEAMAERKVTIDKDDFRMEEPFLVMATQNPLEQKGTYALPEAVMDRFMFKIDLTYPERDDELIILTENNTTKGGKIDTLTKVISKKDILEMQKMVKEVFISDKIKSYILDIIEATRGLNKNIQGIKYVQNGGSPRATIALGIGARAHALTQGRSYVLPEDVRMVAKYILRHRLGLNFKGKAYNVSTDKIVDEILSKVPGI